MARKATKTVETTEVAPIEEASAETIEAKAETIEETPIEETTEVEEELSPAEDFFQGKKPHKKSRRLAHRTKENDIKYRGPMSYQTLRIVGWVFLAITQVALILRIFGNFSSDIATKSSFYTAADAVGYFSNLPLPLFLLANFTFILNMKNNFKRMLVFYGGISLALYAAAIFVATNFIYGFLNGSAGGGLNYWEMSISIGGFLTALGSRAYVFNIFIDLFLCALTFFFLNYVPKKCFKGKNIIFFRLLVLIPILYEIGALLLKYFAYEETITLSYFVFFLIPAKPPFMFVAFVLIALVLKAQSRKYLKYYKSEEMLEEYLETNAHSLRVSISISWIFFLCAILDVIVFIVATIAFLLGHTPQNLEDEAALFNAMSVVSEMGFGNSTALIPVIPFVLLFSYTRKPRFPKFDRYVPIVGVGLILIVFVEGFFLIFTYKTADIVEWLKNLLMDGGSTSEAAIRAHQVIENIKNSIHNISMH